MKSLHSFIDNQEDKEHNHIILHGDVYACLHSLDDDSIDCAITSPPYWDQRDYGFRGQIGNEDTLEEYLLRLTTIFSLIKNKLKPNGVFYLNIGDKYLNKYGNTPLALIPFKIAFYLKRSGWIVEDTIIWYKPNHMPSSVKNRFTNSYEPVFVLTKQKENYFSLIREKISNIIKIPLQQITYAHMATYPENLVEKLVNILKLEESAVILDPFGGSGTTTKAIMNLNEKGNTKHRSILIEGQLDYVNIILKRCGLSKEKVINIDFIDYEYVHVDANIEFSELKISTNVVFDYKTDMYAIKFCHSQKDFHSIIITLKEEDIIYDEGVLFVGLPDNDIINILYLQQHLPNWIIRNIVVIKKDNSWIPLVMLVKDTKLVKYEFEIDKILVNHKGLNIQAFDAKEFIGYKVIRSQSYFKNNKSGYIVDILEERNTGLPSIVVVKWENEEITIEEVINNPRLDYKLNFLCPKCNHELKVFFRNRRETTCTKCNLQLWIDEKTVPQLDLNNKKEFKIDLKKYEEIDIKEKNTKKEYSGKFTETNRKNMGQSPGARASVSEVYFTTQRYYTIPHGLFNDYLNIKRKVKKLSKTELTSLFPEDYKHTVGHWLRNDMGGSLPKVEDLQKLYKILELNDLYFKLIARMGIKLQTVLTNTNGKNPGDYLEITEGQFIGMITNLES